MSNNPPLSSIDLLNYPRQSPKMNGPPIQPINPTQIQNQNAQIAQQQVSHLPPKAALKPSEKKPEPIFNFPIIYVLPSQAKYIHKLNENANRSIKTKK